MARYAEAWDSEKPAHEVTISKPFYMGKFEVTQEQYQQIVGANPSRFINPSLPVEMVSWKNAKEFCIRASVKTAIAMRLPTEAEWEYACRANTQTTYHSGDTETSLARVAWYESNSSETTHQVGQRNANNLDLYDMHGNVWEYCEDDWHDNYETALLSGVAWTDMPRSDYRVLRGGSWDNSARNCRSAYRLKGYSSAIGDHVGFRVTIHEP
jgi:formylglycine-generating enzyme required for sulfatase activity